jgi:hypothetical protein
MNSHGKRQSSHEPASAAQPDSSLHEVHFYVDDALLIDGLQSFIGDAILAGDAAVVIATTEHREKLAQRLSMKGVNLSTAIEDGRYIATDAARMLSRFMVGEWPDTRRFIDVMSRVFQRATAAVESNHPRIAAFGEMVALLWTEGKTQAAVRLEELWNDLAQMHAFSLRCAYPVSF